MIESRTMIPCFICGVELKAVESPSDNQPYEGTAFESFGHYGSTVFDPMDGTKIEINICDSCLIERKNRVLERKVSRPVIVGKHGVCGWELVDRPYIPWNPGANGDFKIDVIHLEVDEFNKLLSQDKIKSNFKVGDLK